jgi:hypothetical protein
VVIIQLTFSSIFWQAIRVRCAFHIVNKGWKVHGPGVNSAPAGKRELARKLFQVLKTWMYTWMRSEGGCETEDEYKISKILFTDYVMKSSIFTEIFEDNASMVRNQVLHFLQYYVDPQEQYWNFVPRLCVRHFNEYTNSGHEGTNHGMKAHGAPVLGSYSTLKSLQTLHFQSEMKYIELMNSAEEDTIHRSVWSSHGTTSRKITRHGENLVHVEWEKAKQYVVWRHDDRKWSVTIKSSTKEAFDSSSDIPLFWRTLEVLVLLVPKSSDQEP